LRFYHLNHPHFLEGRSTLCLGKLGLESLSFLELPKLGAIFKGPYPSLDADLLHLDDPLVLLVHASFLTLQGHLLISGAGVGRATF